MTAHFTIPCAGVIDFHGITSLLAVDKIDHFFLVNSPTSENLMCGKFALLTFSCQNIDIDPDQPRGVGDIHYDGNFVPVGGRSFSCHR